MILCCGEALIDMLPARTAAGEEAFVPRPGGSVFNTAVALGRLGAPAGLFAGLSTDLFGPRLAAAAGAAGVDLSLSPRSSRPTTLAFVAFEGGEARYHFLDEGSAGRMLDPAALPALPAQVTALFLGGISLAAEPCGSAFEALARREAPRRVIMLDPNIRPALVAGGPAHRARLARLVALADIVKLSLDDLAWLEGAGEAPAQARALLGRGPRLVLLTQGAGGAAAYWPGGVAHAPAPAVAVVDTVGAGDTFNAGVLAALHAAGALDRAALADPREAVLRRALGLGVRAAALSVTRPGADPPWAAELR